MKTAEQLMLSRQLNVRSKEMMTVSRLRMLRENAEQSKLSGGKLGLIGQKDLLRLGRLIENDTVTAEIYQDRLDEILFRSLTQAALWEEVKDRLDNSASAR